MIAADDISKYQFIGDQGVSITPCIGFALYLARMDRAGVLDFYERSLDALGDCVKYYSTDTMSRNSKISAKALSTVPTWIEKRMRPDLCGVRFLNVKEYGCVSPDMLHISLDYTNFAHLPESDEKIQEAMDLAKAGKTIRGQRADPVAPGGLRRHRSSRSSTSNRGHGQTGPRFKLPPGRAGPATRSPGILSSRISRLYQ